MLPATKNAECLSFDDRLYSIASVLNLAFGFIWVDNDVLHDIQIKETIKIKIKGLRLVCIFACKLLQIFILIVQVNFLSINTAGTMPINIFQRSIFLCTCYTINFL